LALPTSIRVVDTVKPSAGAVNNAIDLVSKFRQGAESMAYAHWFPLCDAADKAHKSRLSALPRRLDTGLSMPFAIIT
jgi:hypothetical protein